jgi:subfamily B ATP-binding cassette protein MsbA
LNIAERAGLRARPRRLLQQLAALLRPAPDAAPLVSQAQPMTVGDVVRRFWPDLRPLRWWLLLLVVLLAGAPLIAVLEVLLFQRLVDDVLVPATLGPLVWIAALYVGLNLLSAVVSGIDDYLSTWISQKFLVGLRTKVFSHVLAHPSHVHDRNRLGDTMSRLTSDTAAVESFMIAQFASGTGAVLRLAIYAGALFWLQWQLALVAMIAAPLLWWVARHFSRLVKDVSRERRRRAGSLSAVTEERLANAALVQTYNREADAVADYHRQNLAIASAELVGARIRAVFLPLADLAELVGTLAVIALGTWALATDRLTLGGLMAFLALLVQCYSPLRSLGNLLPALYSATAGVERMVELLDEPLPQDAPGARDLTNVRGAVELSGVRMRYPGASRDALHGTSFRVEAGEMVALVGASGAGKSTVSRLLTRHADAADGVVRIDGHDLRDLTARSVREAVTLVPQETALMDATIAENIGFGRPVATRDQVEEAARRADADGFVRLLPHGYDTRVGQRGRSLSGGQRQRIAVARALLRDAPVLFLDEPTTGLDAATSRRLLDAVARHRAGRTVIVATHDPVALEYVDRVIELDDAGVDTQPVQAGAGR